MAGYFSMRIIAKKENEGLVSAQNYYKQIFSMNTYKQFKAEVDLILTTDGHGDCIVPIA